LKKIHRPTTGKDSIYIYTFPGIQHPCLLGAGRGKGEGEGTSSDVKKEEKKRTKLGVRRKKKPLQGEKKRISQHNPEER